MTDTEFYELIEEEEFQNSASDRKGLIPSVNSPGGKYKLPRREIEILNEEKKLSKELAGFIE